MKPTIKPTLKQYKAWQYLLDNETVYLLFGGGAGGGKSWMGAEWLLTQCYQYPGSKWFIGRTELKRLMTTTYITWLKVCKHHNIPDNDWKLNGQYNYIEFANGSRIDLLDVAYQPKDPLYERFGSSEYTGGWLEEAGEIHFMAFDVLKSRIGRHLNNVYDLKPKLFITCNPKKNWLYQTFYKPWKNKELPFKYAFVQSLYGDNPHTSKDYGEQLAEIKDVPTRQRLMFGNWEYEDDPTAMIDYDNIIDLFTNRVLEVDDKYITADIARYGVDLTVIGVWQGFNLYKVIIIESSSLETVKEQIKKVAFDEYVPYSNIIADEDGIGGGVVDGLVGIKGFVGNSTPFEIRGEKPNYQNLRAQCYYTLADMVNNHEISITAEMPITYRDMLIEDLEWVRTKDADKDAKRKVLSKEDIKDEIGRSPDFSDMMNMRMYFTFTPKSGQKARQYKPNIKRRV